jgi:outer membrane receptor protein involved in Fe transport
VNNSKGRLYGVEFELRKGLDFISKKLNNFSAAGNLTLVKSLADVNTEELNLIRGNDPDHLDTRPMFGQSPYIINGTLSYSNDSSGIKANVSFNVFGERLVLVTKGGLPDIYELARPSLDFNLSKEFSKKLKLTFRAKNLLNPDFKQVYKVKTESANYLISTDDESFVYRNYKTGINISLGVSYKF